VVDPTAAPKRAARAHRTPRTDTQTPTASVALSQRQVARLWLPVAFMWLMMSLEQPLVAAALGRLPDPKVNLAAFGLTFSLALIIESPVIMLLTAATALARDRQSYRRLLAFTTSLAVVVGLIHVGVALSPAYGWVITRLIGAPPELVAPGRVALLLMFAWSPAIAVRRLWQGVMIRHDRARRVGLTTVVRIAVLATVCILGVGSRALAGAALGGLALSIAVTAEALVAYALVRSTVRERLRTDEPGRAGLSWIYLVTFYVPLALTSFIVLGGQPLVSLGLGRAPDALVALAVWPVAMGISFVFRSGAYGYQEVVVALLDRAGALPALARFTWLLAVVLSALLAIVALSPLSALWLQHVTGLSPDLVAAARVPLVLLIPVPALSVVVSWYRGRLIHAGRTAVVTQAVGVNLFVLAGVVVTGLAIGLRGHGGAELAAAAVVASLVGESVWLRSRRDGATVSGARHTLATA
jgi:hypothetical protein